MIITKEFLEKEKACRPSLNYVIKNGYIGLKTNDFIHKLINQDRFSDANWLLVRCMNKLQRVKYALSAATQVLHIFEEKYPEDTRPRNAIDAAKIYIKNPCEKTKRAADAAAAAAADAADAYAYDAADAYAAAAADAADAYAYDAADAADAAADAAYAAADAAYAAYAAYAAAADAAYASAVGKKIIVKILMNGLYIINDYKNRERGV